MLFITCELWQITGGKNNTRVDCVLWADVITGMMSSSKNLTCVQNKIPYKMYISDFLDLEN